MSLSFMRRIFFGIFARCFMFSAAASNICVSPSQNGEKKALLASNSG
jgi:hypothetical protein